MDAAATARRMWTLFEPIHVVSYFTPEARAAFEAAGLRGFWRGYFAGRAAPLGVTGAPAVVAAFFVFAPAMVSRAIPGVWELASPDQALSARQAGAVAAIRRLLALPADRETPARVTAAADQLMAAATGLDGAGRSLAAPNIALPVPPEPLARLWHAATLLREHRGDGHVAALVAADIDGNEATALRIAVDRAAGKPTSWQREQMQPARGWTDAEWDAADARLTDRGLLGPDGSATAAGVELHREIERATDLAASRPWASLGPGRVDEIATLLRPIADACARVMPFPNPVGLPAPAGRAS
jgi:Helix-turn-helix family